MLADYEPCPESLQVYVLPYPCMYFTPQQFRKNTATLSCASKSEEFALSCRTSSSLHGDQRSECCGIGIRATPAMFPNRRRPRSPTPTGSVQYIPRTHSGYPSGRPSVRSPPQVMSPRSTPSGAARNQIAGNNCSTNVRIWENSHPNWPAPPRSRRNGLPFARGWPESPEFGRKRLIIGRHLPTLAESSRHRPKPSKISRHRPHWPKRGKFAEVARIGRVPGIVWPWAPHFTR